MAPTRAIRNNNPLNLRISDNPWIGKVYPNTDGAFEQFTSPVFGIRAAMINIRTHCRRHHGLTMAELIKIWAPASDGNRPREYIARVKMSANIMGTEKILYNDRGQMTRLTRAMAEVESGTKYDISIFEQAFDMLYPSA